MFGWMVVNQNNIKKIISEFIKKNSEEINNDTCIDKEAIPGSILLHRMYSELNSNGYKVENYEKIHTFGELIESLSVKNVNTDPIKNPDLDKRKYEFNVDEFISYEENIGIDIESPKNLPDSLDYYQEQFYKDNFSIGEIAYCSSMNDPKSCFAGRFAAKEAIIKANNFYKGFRFSEIEIKVSESGRPIFPSMALSISHVHYENISLSTAIAKNIISNNIESSIQQNNFGYEGCDNDSNLKNSGIRSNSKQTPVYIIVILLILLFYFSVDKYVQITIS
jgi:holo-[acyl-carrier protein] synthase